MANHSFTIFAFTLILSLPIEFSTRAQSKEVLVGTATVSGRVTIKGEPAAGITVFLQPRRTMEPGYTGSIPSAKTDGDGQFRITGVPAGGYFANTQVPGFIMPGEPPAPIMRMQGKSINIADGENIEKIEIELIKGSVITGRVIGANGRPLVEERVELLKLDQSGNPQIYNLGPWEMMLTTDDRGVYRIFGLPGGRYLVSAGSADGIRMGGGAQYQKTYHPNVVEQSQAKVVEVGEGEEVTGVDINAGDAMKTYSIFGRAVSAGNGQPVSGASIRIGTLSSEVSSEGAPGGSGVRTNSKGEFQFSDVPPGKYAAFTAVEPGADRSIN